jgi:lysozyme family protein
MDELPLTDEKRFGSAKLEAIDEDSIELELERRQTEGAEAATGGNRIVDSSTKFDDIKAEYVALFHEAEILPERRGTATEKFSVLWYADQIKQNKARYEQITAPTQVPWFVIGIMHALECAFSFKLHLYNGDPLTDFTKRFPPGFPKDCGEPPFEFNQSAVSALKHEGFIGLMDWSLARTLYRFEQYNGFGYRKRLSMASPYLWSFTRLYNKGKFKEVPKPSGGFRSVYDPNLRSKQCGAGTMLKALIENGDVAFPPS